MNYELLKEFCIDRNIDIRFNEPMSRHTSLKIGGAADIAIFPDESSLSGIIKILAKDGIPYVVVGGGTNILVMDDGIEGAVIFTTKMNNILTPNSELQTPNLITVQSGCPLQKIINLCVEHGLSGMEELAGIPGSVGGAIAGNAGSFGCEIKDVLKSIELLMADGSIKELSAKNIAFEYRMAEIPPNSVILRAALSLKNDDTIAVKKRVTEFINEKKSVQPISKLSAGCVFKNPNGISAGRLIDEVGCKGMQAGDIEVSSMHANFFINTDRGTASDFLRLMDTVSGKVKERTGIVLEPEVRIIGRKNY